MKKNDVNFYDFKSWVVQHNPKLDWNWDDPEILRNQLISVIKESGSLDLLSLYLLFSYSQTPNLTSVQRESFYNLEEY